MFKAFVTGTDANGLRNTVGHIGVKPSIPSRFSLNVLYLLFLFDCFFSCLVIVAFLDLLVMKRDLGESTAVLTIRMY